MTATNPLLDLMECGQSIWLDYLRRDLLTGGELKRLIKKDGLRGINSKLAVFQKALAGSTDYDEALRHITPPSSLADYQIIFEKLMQDDIRQAADILYPVYKDTKGMDGFVCLGLSPDLVNNTESLLKEARRCWINIDRPNLMIKLPASPQSIPAVKTLIAEEINVNITLIFSLAQYESAARVYLEGLKKCAHPAKVSSVASFMVSRVDAVVDKALEEKGSAEALGLKGKAAVANAKIIYKRYGEIFNGKEWKEWVRRGAHPQRPLWTSTGTKKSDCSDVLYAEELIGPFTINSLTPATLNAFRSHGKVTPSINQELEEAESVLESLEKLGINWSDIAENLLRSCLHEAAQSHEILLSTLKEKLMSLIHEGKDKRTFYLGAVQNQVNDRLKKWKSKNFLRRLWAKDSTLWSGKPVQKIKDRLGWLTLPETMQSKLDVFRSFAQTVKQEGISHVLLLGMGGSSLAPEVFQKTFGNSVGYPELLVLDSTHPEAVKAVEKKLDIGRTLFIISSKSGTTLETLSLFRYFWHLLKGKRGNPGHSFITITDPGSPLVRLAKEQNFRQIFLSPRDVGGRYSAFTDFGLVPAALIGVDIHKLVDRGLTASENSSFCVSEEHSAGLLLGAAIGEHGAIRNKLTFFSSPDIQSFPAWLEQLIAESTGKEGKGIVPVRGEPAVSENRYGEDRFFVFLFLQGDQNKNLEKFRSAIQSSGFPLAQFMLKDVWDIGQEIFRWEVAVASAGALMSIHPFNQPDVQLAKDLTRQVMDQKTETGQKPEGFQDEFSFQNPKSLASALKKWFGSAQRGDYIAIQAYLAPSPQVTEALQALRHELLFQTHLATTLGYGPRFLHSTGQLHKGGANKVLVLQIVDDPQYDLPVPETDYTFASLIQAQAWGDYSALLKRSRRVLRVSLKKDVLGGLKHMGHLIRTLF